MATGFEAWLTGYAAGKVLDRLVEFLGEDTLFQKIHKAIEDWAKALPEDAKMASVYALFPNTAANRSEQESKARKVIQARFKDKKIPSEDEWHEGLMEQWRFVKKSLGQDAQNLFMLDEEKAAPHLRGLAKRLKQACAMDDEIRNVTFMEYLERIIEAVEKTEKAEAKKEVTPDDLTEDQKALLKRLLEHNGDCKIASAKGEYESLWVVDEMIGERQWGWERTPTEAALSGKARGDRNERLKWIYVVKDLVSLGLLQEIDGHKNYFEMTEEGSRIAFDISSAPKKK